MSDFDWHEFIGDKDAREADAVRWHELAEKIGNAERLMDEAWEIDDPWPGVIYGGPIRTERKLIDLETWALMRAISRGIGTQMLRQMKDSQ